MLYIVRSAKFLIVTTNVQNVIQIIIVKNFLMGINLDNVFVRKAITMICSIVFA